MNVSLNTEPQSVMLSTLKCGETFCIRNEHVAWMIISGIRVVENNTWPIVAVNLATGETNGFDENVKVIKLVQEGVFSFKNG